jgi:hypothetical protein
MIAADWDVFVASLNVVDLLAELPGGRRDRAMRAVHEARKREIYHPLHEDDWANALREVADWNERHAAETRAKKAETKRRRERAATNRAARAAQPRGHAA